MTLSGLCGSATTLADLVLQRSDSVLCRPKVSASRLSIPVRSLPLRLELLQTLAAVALLGFLGFICHQPARYLSCLRAVIDLHKGR